MQLFLFILGPFIHLLLDAASQSVAYCRLNVHRRVNNGIYGSSVQRDLALLFSMFFHPWNHKGAEVPVTNDQVPILRYTARQVKVNLRSENWQPWPVLSRPSLDGVGTAISLHLIPARTNILLLKKTCHRSPITRAAVTVVCGIRQPKH